MLFNETLPATAGLQQRHSQATNLLKERKNEKFQCRFKINK
jgi:hypothetical protein